MKLLIDEQLLGCGLLLRSIGYDVLLANETGLQKDPALTLLIMQKSITFLWLPKIMEWPHYVNFRKFPVFTSMYHLKRR